MANEQRLIDANGPLKQLSDYMEKLHCPDDYRDGLYRGMEIAESYIKNTPTVDAVQVVRCKRCKSWRCIAGRKDLGYCVHPVFIADADSVEPLTKPDDFCSYGERRTDHV